VLLSKRLLEIVYSSCLSHTEKLYQLQFFCKSGAFEKILMLVPLAIIQLRMPVALTREY
jgi:hypothetical protein